MGEAKMKRASRATDAENSVPGSHGPVSNKSEHVMQAILRTVREVYPDLDLTLFVFEKDTMRYNYASTVDRDDMNAVLRAHLARHGEMVSIDLAMSEEPKGRA